MFNPFREFLAWLNEDDRKPTIRTAAQPAKVNTRGRRNNINVPGTLRIDQSGIAAAAQAMQRAAADMQRQGARMRTQTVSQTVIGGRNVSITNDRHGTHITVNGRTIDITSDGGITVDGEPTITGSRVLGRWADGVSPHYLMSLVTQPDRPAVTISREAANQIENLLIDIEGTNKHTGTRINALRRILSDGIQHTDRQARP